MLIILKLILKAIKLNSTNVHKTNELVIPKYPLMKSLEFIFNLNVFKTIRFLFNWDSNFKRIYCINSFESSFICKIEHQDSNMLCRKHRAVIKNSILLHLFCINLLFLLNPLVSPSINNRENVQKFFEKPNFPVDFPLWISSFCHEWNSFVDSTYSENGRMRGGNKLNAYFIFK